MSEAIVYKVHRDEKVIANVENQKPEKIVIKEPCVNVFEKATTQLIFKTLGEKTHEYAVNLGIPGEKGDPGIGVPAGGTTGQVLTKSSNDDYATTWSDSKGGVVEGYLYNGVFYKDSEHTVVITGKAEELYVNLGTNNFDIYRYNDSTYMKTSASYLTKDQADVLYALKAHTHLHTDITDVNYMNSEEMARILNEV